jgi:hypothetical protein
MVDDFLIRERPFFANRKIFRESFANSMFIFCGTHANYGLAGTRKLRAPWKRDHTCMFHGRAGYYSDPFTWQFGRTEITLVFLQVARLEDYMFCWLFSGTLLSFLLSQVGPIQRHPVTCWTPIRLSSILHLCIGSCDIIKMSACRVHHCMSCSFIPISVDSKV